jgi:hypothetical protein
VLVDNKWMDIFKILISILIGCWHFVTPVKRLLRKSDKERTDILYSTVNRDESYRYSVDSVSRYMNGDSLVKLCVYYMENMLEIVAIVNSTLCLHPYRTLIIYLDHRSGKNVFGTKDYFRFCYF